MGNKWEENDWEALGVAIFHSRMCGPREAKGARKAVKFLTVPSFPTSPGTHLCEDCHPEQGVCADQAKQGHLSGQISILLLIGNAICVAELWGKG